MSEFDGFVGRVAEKLAEKRQRPRDVLQSAFVQDLAPHVRALRDLGWPVEVTASIDKGVVTVSAEASFRSLVQK